MSLPRLSLQAMLLLPILRMIMLTLPRMRLMIPDILQIILNRLLIHLIQQLQTKFNIRQALITPGLREILSNHHSQHLQILCVRRHSICRYHPATLTQDMSESEFIVVFFSLGIQAEGYERETISVPFRHDNEAELLEGFGEVVCCAGEVAHDRAVAVLAEADQLVVLADYLGGAFGEVKGERGLVGA